MPVTNKLLIPCRALDSHFYRLSDSLLCPSLPPRPPCPPLAGLFFAAVPSPFLNPRVSVLSHCRPTTTASSNVHPPPPYPPAPPRVRDPPAQRPPPHPLDATFLASLTPRALLSFCFALVQKPTWAVCSYRCAQRWTRAYGKPEQGRTTRGTMSRFLKRSSRVIREPRSANESSYCVMQADNIVKQELVGVIFDFAK